MSAEIKLWTLARGACLSDALDLLRTSKLSSFQVMETRERGQAKVTPEAVPAMLPWGPMMPSCRGGALCEGTARALRSMMSIAWLAVRAMERCISCCSVSSACGTAPPSTRCEQSFFFWGRMEKCVQANVVVERWLGLGGCP